MQDEVFSREKCYNCRGNLKPLYSKLKDRTFYSDGEWSYSVCVFCEMIYLNPYPSENQIGQYYSSYYTHHNKQGFQEKLFAKIENEIFRSSLNYHNISKPNIIKRLIIKLIPSTIKNLVRYSILKIDKDWGNRVLDVGCGSGALLNKLKTFGWDVQGVDFDENAAANAKSAFQIPVQTGGINDVKVTNDFFDVIVYNHVVEHVFDLKSDLKSAKKLLFSGGRIIVVTPNSNSLCHSLFRKFWRGLEPPRHIMIFNPENLADLAKSEGYNIECLITTSKGARYLFSASMMIFFNKNMKVPNRGVGFIITLLSYLFQLLEYLVNLFSGRKGEEIFMVLKKD